MKAFVERLCDHAGIVRIGPNCEKYGDPYEYAVCYHVEETDAVVKALVSDGHLKPAHAVACVRALREIGLRATWHRFKS
jgi:hypothetical protein